MRDYWKEISGKGRPALNLYKLTRVWCKEFLEKFLLL